PNPVPTDKMKFIHESRSIRQLHAFCLVELVFLPIQHGPDVLSEHSDIFGVVARVVSFTCSESGYLGGDAGHNLIETLSVPHDRYRDLYVVVAKYSATVKYVRPSCRY